MFIFSSAVTNQPPTTQNTTQTYEITDCQTKIEDPKEEGKKHIPSNIATIETLVDLTSTLLHVLLKVPEVKS